MYKERSATRRTYVLSVLPSIGMGTSSLDLLLPVRYPILQYEQRLSTVSIFIL